MKIISFNILISSYESNATEWSFLVLNEIQVDGIPYQIGIRKLSNSFIDVFSCGFDLEKENETLVIRQHLTIKCHVREKCLETLSKLHHFLFVLENVPT